MEIDQLVAWAEEEIAQIKKVLPPEIAEQAEGCFITYEGKPDSDSDLEADTLGLFEGASLAEESDPGSMPKIYIFVGNLWEYAERDEQDYRDEVATTFLHELGHYLGWDEDDVAERGLE